MFLPKNDIFFGGGIFVIYFYYICENISIYTQVFVVLADEPRKFIYGKRRRTLSQVRIYISVYVGIAWAIAFFFTTAFLGPISGD